MNVGIKIIQNNLSDVVGSYFRSSNIMSIEIMENVVNQSQNRFIVFVGYLGSL